MSIYDLSDRKFVAIIGGCECCCSDNDPNLVGTYTGEADGWGDCQLHCQRFDYLHISYCSDGYSNPCKSK